MKLYGIGWDGWKVLNIGSKDDLINQVADNWWNYNQYAIKDSVTNKAITIFTKDEVVNQKIA